MNEILCNIIYFEFCRFSSFQMKVPLLCDLYRFSVPIYKKNNNNKICIPVPS